MRSAESETFGSLHFYSAHSAQCANRHKTALNLKTNDIAECRIIGTAASYLSRKITSAPFLRSDKSFSFLCLFSFLFVLRFERKKTHRNHLHVCSILVYFDVDSFEMIKIYLFVLINGWYFSLPPRHIVQCSVEPNKNTLLLNLLE